ncbi:MAG TPA: helix-turn-helix transcriptional regulator [Streptosporangiaceae bacterium]|nr:helix-turn-helix transcriptional regulator [Streptosporangiaceae bacterium]
MGQYDKTIILWRLGRQMDVQEIGRQLRARRAAAGRTVASVAMDAGLSVPYVANLENGRGNPTLGALTRIASALGTELSVSFEPPGGGTMVVPPNYAEIPLPLVRLGRTQRFRRTIGLISGNHRSDPGDLASQLLNSLALVATCLGHDLAETDCWRLIDALTLIAVNPATGE